MKRAPLWFWIVALLGLLWECAGCFVYWTEMTMDEATIAALPEAGQVIATQRPAWATAAFAISTWGSLLGMILILARKSIAAPLMLIALIAVLVSYIWPVVLSGQMHKLAPSDWVLFIGIPAMQLLLWLFAAHARRKRWLT